MQKIGIICPSEIAYRRFLPALQKAKDSIIFAGIAIANPEEWFGETLSKTPQQAIEDQQSRERTKALSFIDNYGGLLYHSYQDIISSKDIDSIYIPLPPALHYKWAKLALENGKHVFVEKPSTTCLKHTQDLIEIAKAKNLALHENYMFIFHDQIKAIDNLIRSGQIGDVRLYRISFGFPLRAKNDFRYNKELGGGALLDAGGYTLKYAQYLLGNSAKIVTAHSNDIDGYSVDMYGSATLVNDSGIVAQIAFGMDNDYKCELEIWGSTGTLTTGRILTAPVGYIPTYTIKNNQDITTKALPADDAFFKSIMHFVSCTKDKKEREENYQTMQKQETLVEQFRQWQL